MSSYKTFFESQMKTITIHEYESIPVDNWSYLVGYNLTDGVDYTISQYAIHLFNWIKLKLGYALNVTVHVSVSDDVYDYLAYLKSSTEKKSFLCHYLDKKISKNTPQSDYAHIQHVYKTAVLLSTSSYLFLCNHQNLSKKEIKQRIEKDERFSDVDTTKCVCIDNNIFFDIFIPKIITEKSIRLTLRCLNTLVDHQHAYALTYLEILKQNNFPFDTATLTKKKLNVLYFAMSKMYPIDVIQKLVDCGCKFVTGKRDESIYCNAFDRLDWVFFNKHKSFKDIEKAIGYVESIHERFNPSMCPLPHWLAQTRISESAQLDNLEANDIIRFFNFYGRYLAHLGVNDNERLESVIGVLTTLQNKGYDMSRLTGQVNSQNICYQSVLNMYPIALVKAMFGCFSVGNTFNYDAVFAELVSRPGVSRQVVETYISKVRESVENKEERGG